MKYSKQLTFANSDTLNHRAVSRSKSYNLEVVHKLMTMVLGREQHLHQKNTNTLYYSPVLEIIFLYSQDICPFKSSFWSDI